MACVLTFVALALAACAQPPDDEPANLGLLKRELYDYHASGRYQAALAAVAAEALSHLESRAARTARPAIVLDVDETSLSNWIEMEANDFGFIREGPCHLALIRRDDGWPCGRKAWVDHGAAPAIAPTLALYRRAKALGVAVFFVTGRREAMRAATERNLRAAGYADWDGLFMKPADGAFASAADFKAPVRRRLTEQGYAILVNMGDQDSDLAGGYAARAFKLPNPFYDIP